MIRLFLRVIQRIGRKKPQGEPYYMLAQRMFTEGDNCRLLDVIQRLALGMSMGSMGARTSDAKRINYRGGLLAVLYR